MFVSGRPSAEDDGSSSDSDLDGVDPDDLDELMAQRQRESHEKMLQLLGDTTEDLAPPDNVLFVCKLNPVTQVLARGLRDGQ